MNSLHQQKSFSQMKNIICVYYLHYILFVLWLGIIHVTNGCLVVEVKPELYYILWFGFCTFFNFNCLKFSTPLFHNLRKKGYKVILKLYFVYKLISFTLLDLTLSPLHQKTRLEVEITHCRHRSYIERRKKKERKILEIEKDKRDILM